MKNAAAKTVISLLHLNRGFFGVIFIVQLCCMIVLLGSCSKDPEAPPRTRDEIFREKVSLPILYLTAKTKQRVIASKGQGNFLDKNTGEICWRALECRNPKCPSKAANGELCIFIIPDPAVYLKADGTIGFDQKKAKRVAKHGRVAGCPECLKIRNIKSESTATRERYASYAQPHVLPEAAKRLEELDEEYKRRVEWDNKKN